jgi:hypothetical protein
LRPYGFGNLAGPSLHSRRNVCEAGVLLIMATMISGIVNILWGVGAAIGLIFSVIGILCLPIAAFPIVVGILEIIYAAKLLPTPARPAQPARYIAIMEICAILLGNVFSLVAGILALVFYNDPSVQAYFAYLNSQPQPPAPYYPGGQPS